MKEMDKAYKSKMIIEIIKKYSQLKTASFDWYISNDEMIRNINEEYNFLDNSIFVNLSRNLYLRKSKMEYFYNHWFVYKYSYDITDLKR